MVTVGIDTELCRPHALRSVSSAKAVQLEEGIQLVKNAHN